MIVMVMMSGYDDDGWFCVGCDDYGDDEWL